MNEKPGMVSDARELGRLLLMLGAGVVLVSAPFALVAWLFVTWPFIMLKVFTFGGLMLFGFIFASISTSSRNHVITRYVSGVGAVLFFLSAANVLFNL